MKIASLIVVLALTVFGLALAPAAMAQDAADASAQQDVVSVMKETENPGILPDSPFYGLKTGFEKIRLMLVRDRIKRAEMALELAQKRLKEAKILAAMGKPEAMEKAMRNYDAIMERLEAELEKAQAANDTERVAMIEGLMAQLEMHMEEIEDAETVAGVAIQDNRTREAVLQKLDEIRKRIEERKMKVNAKREMVKEMIKKRYNLTDEQAEAMLEKARKEMAEKNIKARAELELKKANRTIVRVEALISKMEERNASSERMEHANEMLATAKELYQEAMDNYTGGDYFTAWELAKESQRMAHLAVARPSEQALYRFLERKKMRERYACGPQDAERIASKLVPGADCKVTGEMKGLYAVRCRAGDKIERFAVRARDCETRNVKDLTQMRAEVARAIRERRAMGAGLGVMEQERAMIAEELRERLRELKEEKGNVTPEDVKNVLNEIIRERVGQYQNIIEEGAQETNETPATETPANNESGLKGGSEEAPPMPVPSV